MAMVAAAMIDDDDDDYREETITAAEITAAVCARNNTRHDGLCATGDSACRLALISFPRILSQ
jgi:hypothetical protein